jgi:hypothetical protein
VIRAIKGISAGEREREREREREDYLALASHLVPVPESGRRSA